ncbi:hypothetical protein NQ314_018217 [Rhamnusium bicolor]|uniref:Uncharacterized protein n=1 Tax=Rhamnusium bicolor TaxID=1586634 RepID=A0AAV8WRD3_9CUCU|nr:hypothetical protein NQ314_018217 [Rhamnusium bicolor]
MVGKHESVHARIGKVQVGLQTTPADYGGNCDAAKMVPGLFGEKAIPEDQMGCGYHSVLL